MSNPVAGQTIVTVRYGTNPGATITGIFLSYRKETGTISMLVGDTYHLFKNYIWASYDKPAP